MPRAASASESVEAGAGGVARRPDVRVEQSYEKGNPKNHLNPDMELERLINRGVQLRPLRVDPDSHEIDVVEARLDEVMEFPEVNDSTIENYMIKVSSMINRKKKLLFPAIDKVLSKYSEVVFMGVAPLGYINPDAINENCESVYQVCLEVTRQDLVSVSYLQALRREYKKYNINSIPYIGPLLADIKLATSTASFVLSILSYRYTLIWLNNRLAALGGDQIAAFLTGFYEFCADPNAAQFEVFKTQHPVVFAVLYQVTSQAISIETFIVLIHQFLSRQNRLAAAAAAAAAAGGPAPAPAGGIPGWNVPVAIGFLGPAINAVAGVVQTSAATTLKMFRPEICWAGFDAAPYVQGGFALVDQRLSAILIRSSMAIEMLSPEGNNLFVSAFLKMKYSHTFSMFDQSIDKREFKIVFIQERNRYVSEIMKVLTDRGLTYVEAKDVLRNVYPQAFVYSIQSTDFEDDGTSVRSRGSSVWTVIGSTASSMWRADQAVQAQQLAESTVFNWFLRKATHVLTTCSETILYGTMGVATFPGAYEPPIFGQRQTPSQLQAVSRATHAVTVFDQWIETLRSEQFMDMPGTTPASVINSLDRIKYFYRLKCQTRVLANGDIVYVMDADNVTSLQDTITSLQGVNEEDTKTLSNCLSAILQYSQVQEQQQVMLRLSQIEAARRQAAAAPLAAGGVAAAAPLAAGAEVEPEVRESCQIALATIIPPAQILEAIVRPEVAEAAAGGGGAAAAGGVAQPLEDSLPEDRYLVERDMDEELRNRDVPPQNGIDTGQPGGRSRKRSSSKRTRRKDKQSSKKLKRKSRRYVRRRRSIRRKN